jgi:hypothetical protein
LVPIRNPQGNGVLGVPLEVSLMRRPKPRRPRSRLARCARWLGLDRNPLRRGSDRLEAVIRLVTIVLLAAAVPLAAAAVGQWAYHSALRHAHAQQASEHVVTAVLQAPATESPDPYSALQDVWVLARWQPPGLPARFGPVLAPAGAGKGSTVQTWVDASGAVTSAPLTHRDVVGEVWLAVIVTCIASCFVLFGLELMARRALDCRRLNAWESEWRATGPLWSGHLS